VQSGRAQRLVTLSNLLAEHTNSDEAQSHIEKRELQWFDAGYGIPPHPLRGHG
jgi:hypothetical protein